MSALYEVPVAAAAAVPFDLGRLDRLLEEAELDAVLVTSKHNIQYLLGGYRYFFYSNMDAHGLSRYLPVLVYPRGAPDRSPRRRRYPPDRHRAEFPAGRRVPGLAR